MRSFSWFALSLLAVMLAVSSACADSNFKNAAGTGDLVADGGFYVVLTFKSKNIIANLDTELLIGGYDLGDTNAAVGSKYYTMPFNGSIIGISIRCTATPTAGAGTVEVTKNGTGIELYASWTKALTSGADYTTQAKDTDTFSAGDYIGVDITTGSTWAPITSDIVVMVLVEM